MWTLKNALQPYILSFGVNRMVLRMILRKSGRATHCGLCQPCMGVLFGLKELSQEDDFQERMKATHCGLCQPCMGVLFGLKELSQEDNFQERMKALTLPGLLGEETPKLQ